MHTITIGGHRGLGATDNETARQWRDSPNLIPENTLAAFVGAFEAGADFIEFDVVPAKDGLIVTHSAKLADHIFPPPHVAYTAELTLDELAKLPTGHRHAPQDRMPILAAVLDAVQPYMTGERFLNIEVKGLGGLDVELGAAFPPDTQRGFISAILQTVHAAGLLDRILFSSFQTSNLRLLRSLYPPAKLGQLFTEKPERGYLAFNADNLAITLSTLPGAALHPPLQSYSNGTAPVVPPECTVNLWALREEPVERFLPHWQQAIATLGPTRKLGLITDYPRELRAALKL